MLFKSRLNIVLMLRVIFNIILIIFLSDNNLQVDYRVEMKMNSRISLIIRRIVIILLL